MSESFLRLTDVQRITGLGRSTIYRLIGQGQFPPPVKVGPRVSAWLTSEIEAWLRERVAETRGAA